MVAAATPTSRDGVLGALTTPFLAPEWCSRSFTVHPPHQDGAVTWGTRYLDSSTTRSCYPPGFETFNWGKFYSPAVCPSGWTSAGTWKDYGTRKILDYTPLPGEAAIYCCPSEYTYWDFIEVCTSTIGAGSHRPTLTIVDGPPTDNPASDALTSYTTTGPFSLGGHAMYAVPTAIQVRFQASDTSLLGLTGFPTTGTPSPTPGPNGASSSQSTSSSSIGVEAAGTDAKTDAISNAQLSTGAKAGIGAGAALGVILLAVAAFFVFRRRRQQSLAQVAAGPNPKRNIILAEKGDDRPPELSDSALEKPPEAHTIRNYRVSQLATAT
ncbi:hypothetical protein B0T24DRAFT_681619 [Lasiosphaeria ovina]|uniref:Uncharacterized protein n=1 Tax=Lasiosphaeria ovina TaxID=92902 RepID=A0AAE0K3U0_9PEZI|nr:hypothetical protein B0T24DRAFT_681619 [Lasiosphaeria ovina]